MVITIEANYPEGTAEIREAEDIETAIFTVTEFRERYPRAGITAYRTPGHDDGLTSEEREAIEWAASRQTNDGDEAEFEGPITSEATYAADIYETRVVDTLQDAVAAAREMGAKHRTDTRADTYRADYLDYDPEGGMELGLTSEEEHAIRGAYREAQEPRRTAAREKVQREAREEVLEAQRKNNPTSVSASDLARKLKF